MPIRKTIDEAKKDRSYLDKRFSQMETEFVSFKSHYKELAEFIDPRRGRFFTEDRNKGDKRFKHILNNAATMALRSATAGMLAGAMSPSRPWFAYTTIDRDIAEDEQAKQWLSLLQRVILLILAKSNFYNMAPLMLRELLLFGTAAMSHVDDFEDVARFYTHTAGSYFIAQNSRQVVDTLARKFQMTTYQMVKKFGLNNVSQAVKNSYNNGNYGTWFTVAQFIEQNPFRDDNEFSSEFMPYRSVYFEPSNSKSKARGDDKAKFLRESGFPGFPAYVPRWELAGEDIYAVNCPGMTNLGDVKQLQSQELEKSKAIAKASTPPLQGPPSLRNSPIPNLPGGVTINTATGDKITSLYDVDPRIQEMLLDIDATSRRIDRGFYVDLFLAITNQRGIQPKNELQLSQINEERLLQLGPVLEQIHGEWLDKMVQRVARQVFAAGIMPKAPKRLQGKPLQLEFVSALAMAQRSVNVSATERTIGFASSLQEAGWNVQDKIDADFALEDYTANVGGDPRLLVPDEEVEAARTKAAEQQSNAQRLEQAAAAANMVKQAADAKLGDDNVLSSAVGR